MTTKRKPEDVVLNSEAFDKAIIADIKSGEEGGGMDSRRVAFARAYIAEADLIPRPQTSKEWAEQMPESVWVEAPAEANHVSIAFFSDSDEYTRWIREIATIPRPKPPRMTDEEIDKAAIIYASNCIEGHFAQDGGGAYLEGLTLDDLVEAGSVYHKAYLAERVKLEKERGER